MKYILEIDDKECDEFIRVFFNGVTVPVSSGNNAEKRLINKVTALAHKFEKSLVK